MIRSKNVSRAARAQASFTLIELLITISIMAMMAGMILFALYSAQETAKEAKTKAMIAKLDSIIKAKWDAYRTRRVPVQVGADRFIDANGDGVFNSGDTLTYDANGNGSPDSAATNAAAGFSTPLAIAKLRLDGLHELMRMEMPDSWQDVIDGPLPKIGMTRPAVSQGYLRKFNAAIATGIPRSVLNNVQGAECLYQIVASGISEDGGGLELFSQGDIGDTDGDGMPEFLDGWKRPIRFLRWAPGFFSELNVVAYGRVSSFTRGSAPTIGNPTGTPSTLVATNDPDKAPLTPNAVSLFSQNKTAYPSAALYLTGSYDMYSAKIQSYSGYAMGATSVTFSFAGESNYPFGSIDPTGETFVILAPDPFDPLDVYGTISHSQLYPLPGGNQSAPFALYPLIYSAGPDGIFGVASSGLQYSIVNEYPFIVPVSGDPPVGSMLYDNSKEGTTSKDCWRDNVHNHMMNLK